MKLSPSSSDVSAFSDSSREFLQFALESYSLVILCDNMSVWQSYLSERRPPPLQHLQKIERHNVELALAAADSVCIFSENVAGEKATA